MLTKIKYVFIGLGLLLFSCENSEKNNSDENIPVKQEAIIQELKSPAKMSSSVPNLFINKKGKAYLSWTESNENEKSTLYFSTLINDNWEQAIKIAEGTNWVVNWADFPSLTQFGTNLVTNVLIETDPETFAYDVQLIISNDNGKTWNAPFVLHNDKTKTEHGFVSLVPYNDNSFMVIWLDGRKYATGEDEMTLRAAIISQEGKIIEEFILDERVCDCCSTNAIKTNDGIAVVYRNRDENEERDMSIVYFKDNKWTAPQLVFKDSWIIAGCPVNGAAIDANKNQLGVAWFTEAEDRPAVKFAFADGFGNDFNIPTTINTTTPVGRVDFCYIDDETAVISWMEGDKTTTYLKVRTINTDGTNQLGEVLTVTEMNGGRAVGFPKMVKKDNQLYFTWTVSGNKSTIKTATISISNLN